MDSHNRPANSPKYPRLVEYYDHVFFSVGGTEARVNLKDFNDQRAETLYRYICQSFQRRGARFGLVFNNGEFTSDNPILLDLLRQDVFVYAGLEEMYFRDCDFGRSSILALLHIITATRGQIRSIHFSHCRIVELIDTQVFQQEVRQWLESAGANTTADLHFTERGLSLDLVVGNSAKSFNVSWDCFYGSLDIIGSVPAWMRLIPQQNQWTLALDVSTMCLSHEELLKLYNFVTSLGWCTRLELGSWESATTSSNANLLVLNMIRNRNISAMYVGYSTICPCIFPVDALAEAISDSTSMITLNLCCNFGNQSASEYVERLSKEIKSPNRLRLMNITNRNGFERAPVEELNRKLQRMQTLKAHCLISMVHALRARQLGSASGDTVNSSQRTASPLLMLNLDIIRKLADFLADV